MPVSSWAAPQCLLNLPGRAACWTKLHSLAPLSACLQRMPRNLRSALWLRQASLPAALYLLLTIAFPVAGLTYFLAPKVSRVAVNAHTAARAVAVAVVVIVRLCCWQCS
jgi:hypothetical protein